MRSTARRHSGHPDEPCGEARRSFPTINLRAASIVFALVLGCTASEGTGPEPERTGAGIDDERLRSEIPDTAERDFDESIQEVWLAPSGQDVGLDDGGGDSGDGGGGGVGDGGDARGDDVLSPLDDAEADPPLEGDALFDTPAVANPLVIAVVETSRAAVRAWCECCSSRFGDSMDRCLGAAFDGGLIVEDCQAAVYDRLGAGADAYLRCIEAAFAALAACNAACNENDCAACQTQLVLDRVACDRDHPDVRTQLARCAE